MGRALGRRNRSGAAGAPRPEGRGGPTTRELVFGFASSGGSFRLVGGLAAMWPNKSRAPAGARRRWCSYRRVASPSAWTAARFVKLRDSLGPAAGAGASPSGAAS